MKPPPEANPDGTRHNNKRHPWQRTVFTWLLQILFVKYARGPSEKHPMWSIWLNNNYSLSNNNIQQQLSYPWATSFSPDNEILSVKKLPPPLRGGNSSSKESPALPIPSYPALCREDTTSWNHGRPRAGVRPKSLITMELRVNRDNHVNGSLFLIVLWPSTRSRFAISGCSWSACGGHPAASNSIVISSFGRYLICVAEIADHDVSERKKCPTEATGV